MRASAIVVAAGSGQRLGADLPKSFVLVGGRPMLFYSIRTLAEIDAITEAVVAVPAGMEAATRALVGDAGLSIPVKLAAGGIERQDSVRIALGLTSAESELVIVHDAARPFATARLFDLCLKAAQRAGGAIAALPVSDTLKRVDGNVIRATVSRSGLYQAQTPQAFQRRLLVEAHQQAARDGVAATDDADLVARLGAPVEVIDGSPLNFKITTRSDLELAHALVNSASGRITEE